MDNNKNGKKEMSPIKDKKKKDLVKYEGEQNNTRPIDTRKTFLIRGFIAAVLFTLLFVLLAVRLAVLQLIDADEYKKNSYDQYVTERTITAKRGTIYDCNYTPLAVSATVNTIFISPNSIKNDEQEKVIVDGLSELLDVEKSFIEEKAAKKYSQYQVIKRNVEEETSKQVRQFIIDNNLKLIVSLEESTKRYYPYGTLASHLIGIVGTDGGLSGIELSHDEMLKGIDGKSVKGRDALLNDLPFKYETYIEAQAGANVVTTIDVTVQRVLEKNLKQAMEDNKPKVGVAGIVMDVNTGEILASAVYPDYDLNDPYTLSEYYADKLESFTGTDEEKKKEATKLMYNMWSNRVVTSPYEPGSTFKIITSAMALDEKVFTTSSTFVCDKKIVVAGLPIHCHKASGHGLQTFGQALQNSCNPAFVTMGLGCGIDTYLKYFEAFGYTGLSGTDILGEAATYYFKTSGTQFTELELAVYSFGQTFKTTMIQHIRGVSAIANGGYLVTPHVVKALVDDDMNIIKTFDYENERQVISKETADTIVQILYEGTDIGSTKNVSVAGYSIAAKTGTSQKRDVPYNPETEREPYVGSCVAFAPAEDPQIAILVIIDEPTGQDYYGGLIAAPVISRVLTEVLPYLGIPANDSAEITEVTVKDYRGAEIESVKLNLTELKLKYRTVGDGASVIDQMPRSGAKLTEGGTVILYTEDNSEKTTVTVPDVIGKTPERATAMLINNKLNILVTGSYRDSVEGVANAAVQSPAAGTEVPEGTVVKVEFRYYEGVD